MPEAPVAAPPAPAAPPSAPAPTPTPSPAHTMESALAEFDAVASPKPASAHPKAPEGTKPPEGAKPPETHPKPTTPPSKPEPKGEAQLRKELARVNGEFQKLKDQHTTELSSVQEKMKTLEQKRYWTPDEEKRYKAMEERQQQLEAELYTRDYRASPEFTEKYQKRADKVFATVGRELKGMTVQYQEDDENKSRPATLADFNRIRALSDSLPEQRRLAKSLFGEDADIMLGHARELSAIEENANEEITTRQLTYATTRKQAEEKQAEENRVYESSKSQFEKLLIQKYPDMFGEDATNPEATDALRSGLSFVDSTVSNAGKMTAEERAMKNSLVRLMAGSWQRNIVKIRQLQAKVDELTADIGKYRKSDPGSGGGAPPSPPATPPRGKGISGMAAEFDKIQRM
jgi:flagellar motility protein MotE (MotC chaperone)